MLFAVFEEMEQAESEGLTFNGYNWNQLWLVFLGTGTSRNIPKQLPKLPLFWGSSCLLWPNVDCLAPPPCWQESMASEVEWAQVEHEIC